MEVIGLRFELMKLTCFFNRFLTTEKIRTLRWLVSIEELSMLDFFYTGFRFISMFFFHSPKVEVGLFRLNHPLRFTIALTYFQSQYLATKLDPAWTLLPRWDVSSLASSLW